MPEYQSERKPYTIVSFPFELSIAKLNSEYRLRTQRGCIEIAVNNDYYYYRQSTCYYCDDFRSRFSQRYEKNKNYTVVIVHTRMVNVIIPHANRPVPTLRYSHTRNYYFLFTYREIYLFANNHHRVGRGVVEKGDLSHANVCVVCATSVVCTLCILFILIYIYTYVKCIIHNMCAHWQ